MAWLFRFKDSKRWWIGTRLNGKVVSNPTGTPDRDEAERHLAACVALERAHKAGSPLDTLYHALKESIGQGGPRQSLQDEVASWLAETKRTSSPSTLVRYSGVAKSFTEFMKATPVKPPLEAVTSEHVRAYLEEVLKLKSAATVNQERKCLRVLFRRAVANGRLKLDPCASVKPFRKTSETRRRPFTLEEVRTIVSKSDGFWRYAVLVGFHTGLRMSDIAGMPVGAVDLGEALIRLSAKKTGSRVTLPLPPEVVAVISKRIGELDQPKPEDPLWPEQAAARSGTLSNGFQELLVTCGLAEARTHRSKGKGRKAEREGSKISFHSLRHTFVTTLKATGSGQAIAKSLAGHSSDAVSDHYTSLPVEVLREAVNRLPSITEGAK